MNIKVCGVTSMKQIQQLDGLDIEFAGIVFDKKSPQYVAGKLDGEALKTADLDIRKVGVFLDAGYDEIIKTVQQYGLDMVQLEGSEPPELCRKLSGKTEVIKTFFIDNHPGETIDSLVEEYDDTCDYYSFDTVVKKNFSGIAGNFDWQKIAASKIEKPFFLGGGIRPGDLEVVRQFRHPDFYGIDLNCYFEKEPGVKDMALILAFVSGLRKLKS